MGKVNVEIKLSNLFDEEKVKEGAFKSEDIRTVETVGLVDTGATTMAIPRSVANALGLKDWKEVQAAYADGRIEKKPVVRGLLIKILDRETVANAVVEENGKDVLIGQVVLEELDLMVDAKRGVLTPNPESPDMPLLDLL